MFLPVFELSFIAIPIVVWHDSFAMVPAIFELTLIYAVTLFNIDAFALEEIVLPLSLISILVIVLDPARTTLYTSLPITPKRILTILDLLAVAMSITFFEISLINELFDESGLCHIFLLQFEDRLSPFTMHEIIFEFTLVEAHPHLHQSLPMSFSVIKLPDILKSIFFSSTYQASLPMIPVFTFTDFFDLPKKVRFVVLTKNVHLFLKP